MSAPIIQTGLSAENPPNPPFDNTRDRRFFYESKSHGEAISRLLFLAEDKGMGMGLLTGEIGAGKTLLRTVLHARLNPETHLRVSIENSLLGFDDLLLEVISQIRGERVFPKDLPDRYTRLSDFKNLLTNQVAAQDRHLVILLDEAQMLPAADLDALKGLTNIASEKQNFLTLILIGQPELREHLRQLPQVDQRIALRFHLNALTREDTEAYVDHRLKVAGYRGEPLLDASALKGLHRATRGVPREINRICKIGLDHALNIGATRLSREVIDAVVRDLRRHGGVFEAGLDQL